MPKSKYPHIEWVDLQGDGTLVEVAVIKRDQLDNLYFIKVNSLDDIDKRRLFKIITNRNANLYELWDLMSNVTLGNGVNALEYFHQLVKMRTPAGKIMTPTSGAIGAALQPKSVTNHPSDNGEITNSETATE